MRDRRIGAPAPYRLTFKVSRAAIIGGCAAGFAAGWNIANTGAVADELSGAYGVGLGVVGLLTTALFLAHLLMQLPSGRLSDRFGPWAVCAAGVGVLGISNCILAIAPVTPLALSARFGAGTRRQLSYAALAASTARSVSSTDDFGKTPIVSPVAGFVLSKVSPLAASTHSPPM